MFAVSHIWDDMTHPQVGGGDEGLQNCIVTVNIVNKQLQADRLHLRVSMAYGFENSRNMIISTFVYKLLPN